MAAVSVSQLLGSLLQALPRTQAEVLEKCGLEAVRAQWLAPYIVHTVTIAMTLGMSSDVTPESLDDNLKSMFVWGWQKAGATTSENFMLVLNTNKFQMKHVCVDVQLRTRRSCDNSWWRAHCMLSKRRIQAIQLQRITNLVDLFLLPCNLNRRKMPCMLQSALM